MHYYIRRVYQNGENRVLRTNMSEAAAIRHCNNLETSSSTCINAKNVQHTQEEGPWFDIYSPQRLNGFNNPMSRPQTYLEKVCEAQLPGGHLKHHTGRG